MQITPEQADAMIEKARREASEAAKIKARRELNKPTKK